jgi:signal transduction histidine kinase/NO-binding membrane sensor protein with MHYT domain/ActR/RegA family two-component response regulator
LLKVLSCVTTEHDLRLVVLAVIVALSASTLAVRLYGQALIADRFFRRLWVGAGAVAAGSGIWATHFIGMLAFQPGLPTGYEPIATVVSWLAAVVGVGGSFTMALAWPRPLGRALAGAGLGLSIAAMHYIGMSAFRAQGYLLWDEVYVVGSVTLGVALSIAALSLADRPRRGRPLALSSGLLTLAICAMHFTAMAAVSIVPDSFVEVPKMLVSAGVMALTVAALSAFLALGVVGIILIDARSQMGALAQLREAIDAMPDGLAFFDADDRYVMWNAAYARMGQDVGLNLRPGLPYAAQLQAALDKGYFPDAKGRERSWLRSYFEQRRSGVSEMDFQYRDRWLRLRDRRTPHGGTVSVATDITALKQNAAMLAQARDAAEAANRAKSEFLANMSHEIRTPLNGIVGLTQVLNTTRLSARQREMLSVIDTSAQTLQAVLADILDLARIEAGRLELSTERFGLSGAVNDAAGLWRLQAEKKGLTFELEIAPDAGGEVEGDAVRLRQILVNLLSNAVKFTDAGTVSLKVARVQDGVQFEVSDSGVGFTPEQAERLFDRFEQADGSVTRRFGGTGLGLAICRELSGRMGGTIVAEGRPGEGATFRLTLPMEVLGPAAPQADPAAEYFVDPEGEPAPAAKPLQVLVAEDHPVNRQVLQLMLEAVGVGVEFAVNGQEALEAVGTKHYDAVLMDMQMPVMDGLTATQGIREREAREGLDRMPVIMLTAHAMPEHVESSREAGADHHLAKPIQADALFAILDEIERGVLLGKAEAA